MIDTDDGAQSDAPGPGPPPPAGLTADPQTTTAGLVWGAGPRRLSAIVVMGSPGGVVVFDEYGRVRSDLSDKEARAHVRAARNRLDRWLDEWLTP